MAQNLRLGRASLPLGRGLTHVMGIVNVTPDSFSDGGRYLDSEKAIAHGVELANEGAAILDVGGESTRPGAPPATLEDELQRVVPVIEGLSAATSVLLSIDTRKPHVARAAVEAGAVLVNDVGGLRDPGMRETVAELGVGAVIMHMLGEPTTMQSSADPATAYGDVVADVLAWLKGQVELAGQAGIEPERLIIDPGIGFGKTVEQNLELIARLEEFTALGLPLLVGPSRKSFIGAVAGGSVGERLEGTLSAVAACTLAGADFVRVHEAGPVVKAVKLASAIAAHRAPGLP